MKHLNALLVFIMSFLLLGAAVIAAIPPEETDAATTAAPIMIYGKVAELLEDGSIRVVTDNEENPFHETIIHLGEAPLMDAVNFQPLERDLAVGDVVRVWIGEAATLSLPPQVMARLLVVNEPEFERTLQFYEIINVNTSTSEEQVILPVAGGETITLTETVQLSPWKTRQIVGLSDLIPGAEILAAYGEENTIEKVILFPYAYRGYLSFDAEGNVFENGEKLSVTAKTATHGGPFKDMPEGETFLPIRAASETLGMDVRWDPELGAVVSEAGEIVFTAKPGEPSLDANGEEKFGGLCVFELGVTYLPAHTLTALLNIYLCK